MTPVIWLMTIFSVSFVEISCGGKDVVGELGESENGIWHPNFMFTVCGPRLLNNAGHLSCTGNHRRFREGNEE